MNIVKRHILYIKKVRLRHDSPISVNARVIQIVLSSKRVLSLAISLRGSNRMVLQLTPFLSSSMAKKDRIFALCHDDKFANGLNSLVPELIMTTFF